MDKQAARAWAYGCAAVMCFALLKDPARNPLHAVLEEAETGELDDLLLLFRAFLTFSILQLFAPRLVLLALLQLAVALDGTWPILEDAIFVAAIGAVILLNVSELPKPRSFRAEKVLEIVKDKLEFDEVVQEELETFNEGLLREEELFGRAPPQRREKQQSQKSKSRQRRKDPPLITMEQELEFAKEAIKTKKTRSAKKETERDEPEQSRPPRRRSATPGSATSQRSPTLTEVKAKARAEQEARLQHRLRQLRS